MRTAPPMITTSEDLLYAPDSLDHGRKIGGSQQRLDLVSIHPSSSSFGNFKQVFWKVPSKLDLSKCSVLL